MTVRFPPLIEGRLQRRYKRFLADVELPAGEVITVHCANPGSMKTCAPDNARVWLSVSDNPKRKLPHSWELVQVGEQMVCVNTVWGNRLVEEALRNGCVPELSEFHEIRREVKTADGHRIDFALSNGEVEAFVEVKSVTLAAEPGVCSFPDAVTLRGQKHLRELMRLAALGHRAVLFFCVSRYPTLRVRPADEIDSEYGRLLRQAHAEGVEILAYAWVVDTEGMRIASRLPVDL